MRYQVYFDGGNQIIINEEILKVIKGERALVDLDQKIVLINYQNIDYIKEYDFSETQSTIIKPPTPAELKAQEERNKEADDITLEGQLSKL